MTQFNAARIDADRLGGAGTILLVDDEGHILHVLSVILRNSGYRIFAASSSEEALELLRRFPAQLVVSDLHITSADGVDLAASLYTDLRTRHIPVVVLTGHRVERADELPPNVRCVISKPFSPRHVLHEVERLAPRSTEARAEAA